MLLIGLLVSYHVVLGPAMSYGMAVASVPAVTNPDLLAEFRAVSLVLRDFVVVFVCAQINR